MGSPHLLYNIWVLLISSRMCEFSSRGSVHDHGEDMAQVHREGLQVGVGEVPGLLLLQSLWAGVHTHNAVGHLQQVAQVLWDVLQGVGVLARPRAGADVCSNAALELRGRVKRQTLKCM